MATGTGLNVSKVNGFAVLWLKPGGYVSKTNAYAALFPLAVDPPTWPSFTFSPGMIGVSYEQRFTPGGTAPVTVTVQSGSLPTGLTLANVSGSTYKISGTPTTIGTFSFTLRATNSYGTADASFSITIVAPSGAGGSYCYVS